jgi:hypothetical protein
MVTRVGEHMTNKLLDNLSASVFFGVKLDNSKIKKLMTRYKETHVPIDDSETIEYFGEFFEVYFHDSGEMPSQFVQFSCLGISDSEDDELEWFAYITDSLQCSFDYSMLLPDLNVLQANLESEIKILKELLQIYDIADEEAGINPKWYLGWAKD